MRLTRSVGNGSSSLGAAGGQHNINGCSDACHIEYYIGADQSLSFCGDDIAAFADLCPQCAHTLDMKVHWSLANPAAAGLSYLNLAEARKKSTQHIIGRTQLGCHFRGHYSAVYC